MTTASERQARRTRSAAETVRIPLPERPSTADEIAALAASVRLSFGARSSH